MRRACVKPCATSIDTLQGLQGHKKKEHRPSISITLSPTPRQILFPTVVAITGSAYPLLLATYARLSCPAPTKSGSLLSRQPGLTETRENSNGQQKVCADTHPLPAPVKLPSDAVLL